MSSTRRAGESRAALPRLSVTALPAVLLWLSAGLLSLPASARTPVTLLDAQWQARDARLVEIDGGVVRHYDERRVLRETPTDDVVRLRFVAAARESTDRAAQPSGAWLLALVDGQRIAGTPSGAERKGDALRWAHPGLGEFVVSLEHVSRMTRVDQADTHDRGTADGDTVTLRNGDALSGFVTAVTDGGVTLETADGAEVELPWDNTAALRLANPAVLPTERSDVVALRDGSRLYTGPVSVSAGVARVSPRLLAGEGFAEMPTAAVAAVDFAASGVAVHDLSALPMTVEAAGEAFGLSYPPRWDGGALWLHAPSIVSFTLPGDAPNHAGSSGRATRAAGWVEWVLPDHVSPALVELLSVRVRFGESDVVTLSPNQRVRFNAGVGGDAFGVTVDAAEAGPVLGRVRLSEVVVLRPQPEEPRSASVP